MTDTAKRASRTAVEWGLELTWEGQVLFLEQKLLVRLADQGQWDSQFGHPAVSLLPQEGAALVREGLAVRETRGGYHGTDKLRDLLKEFGWWTDD